jgi:hypothetical protein
MLDEVRSAGLLRMLTTGAHADTRSITIRSPLGSVILSIILAASLLGHSLCSRQREKLSRTGCSMLPQRKGKRHPLFSPAVSLDPARRRALHY